MDVGSKSSIVPADADEFNFPFKAANPFEEIPVPTGRVFPCSILHSTKRGIPPIMVDVCLKNNQRLSVVIMKPERKFIMD